MELGIRAGRLITPDEEMSDVFVGVEAGTIRSVEPFRDELATQVRTFLDARDRIVAPGFIDLQVNGALRHNFRSAEAAQRQEVYQFYLRRGTTTLAPTLVTAEPAALAAALSALAEDVGAKDSNRPEIPGLHLEGPFINPERRGAHPVAQIRRPDLALARELFEAAHRRIAILTLAPELEGASELIRWFAAEGVVVAAGHTMASCDAMLRASEEGIRLVTHMGNMSDWPHRRKTAAGIFASDPGVVGAFLISDHLRGSVILDGYHLDPRLAVVLMRVRGPDNLALVSDASYATGCSPGDYDDGLVPTTVHPDGYAYATKGGGWLAGSIVTLERAVQIAVQKGKIALRDAIAMATLTPARILGIEKRKGQIAPGADADLVFLDEQLTVKQVIRAGQMVPKSR